MVDDDPGNEDDGTGYSKVDAVIMKEVAAWLELREHDEFWVSRRDHAGKVRLLLDAPHRSTIDKTARSFQRPANSLHDSRTQTLL